LIHSRLGRTRLVASRNCFGAETLEALERLIEAGKVLYIGFSNFEPWRLAAAMVEASPALRRSVASVPVRYKAGSRFAEGE